MTTPIHFTMYKVVKADSPGELEELIYAIRQTDARWALVGPAQISTVFVPPLARMEHIYLQTMVKEDR